ncbi:hypothetical protein NQZ68_013846 [Dissostichus eleginoides]|nr:hypothetical protein NQZ68_013846 [Dissostichus eleginoides]
MDTILASGRKHHRGRGGWGRRQGPGRRNEAAGEGRGPTRARAPPPRGGGRAMERAVKAGSLSCNVGTGVNNPVVPSREERSPAAGERAAAAGTKSLGGMSGIPGRQE